MCSILWTIGQKLLQKARKIITIKSNKMPLLDKVGPGLIGTGMGLLLEGHNDRRQLDMQQKLQDMQMKGQKDMALFNYQQQMKMWNDTNYKAQVSQLNKAGLNPGLLYGMGGAGGQSINAAQGQGPGMGEAPKGGGEAMGMGIVGAQTAAQLALLKAQKENIEADTANKTATTPNIEADTVNKILDSVIKDFTGRDLKDVYERISVPNRGVAAKTNQDELEARQAIATNIYELWTEGKLKDKSVAEIEQILVSNAKGRQEIANIQKNMDLLDETIKGAKLDNIIKEIETRMQQETGIDKSAPTWIKLIGRLFGGTISKAINK